MINSMAISVKDAALALSISERTIRKYIAHGKLPCVRIGRRVLLEPHAIEGLLQQGRSTEVTE